MKNESIKDTNTRDGITTSALTWRNALRLFCGAVIGLAVGAGAGSMLWSPSSGAQPSTTNSQGAKMQNVPVEILPVRHVAKFPAHTFLESIVIAADGTLFITSNEDGKIIRMRPNGKWSVQTTVPGKPIGLAFAPDSSLLVTGQDDKKISALFRVSSDGKVETLMTMPDAIFPNGLTRLVDDRYLMADSYRGAIWELDISQRSARIWLEHPLLAQASSESRLPAVNGLKIFNGVLYASNLDKAHLVRIPVSRNGKPGKPEIFVQRAAIDDFAFDVEGNLYGATHLSNNVMRIAPNGNIAIIAQAEQGVVGCTAVAFGRAKGDRTGIYVVGDGGIAAPPPTGVVPAEVVRIEVGKVGLMI